MAYIYNLQQNFLSVRLDHNTTDKIIKLFSGKTLYYSKDKNFGKLVLSFLKINTALSKEQKNIMAEPPLSMAAFSRKSSLVSALR